MKKNTSSEVFFFFLLSFDVNVIIEKFVYFGHWNRAAVIYQIISDCTKKTRQTLLNKLKIKTDCFSYRLWQRMITFILVCFIWLFFRAGTLTDAVRMCQRIFFELNPSILLGDVLYNQGLSQLQIYYLFVAIAVLLFVDYLHEKGKSVRMFLQQQNLVFRWLVYYAAVFIIVVSVLQTFGQNANTFIYFQF